MKKPHGPISRSDAEHYTWGDACDGWHLLDEPGMRVIEERVPPGAGETRHFHTTARQLFYILSGSASMEFDDGTIGITEGQCLHVPPGIVHRFVNSSDREVRFLVFSAPSTRGDRIGMPEHP